VEGERRWVRSARGSPGRGLRGVEAGAQPGRGSRLGSPRCGMRSGMRGQAPPAGRSGAGRLCRARAELPRSGGPARGEGSAVEGAGLGVRGSVRGSVCRRGGCSLPRNFLPDAAGFPCPRWGCSRFPRPPSLPRCQQPKAAGWVIYPSQTGTICSLNYELNDTACITSGNSLYLTY